MIMTWPLFERELVARIVWGEARGEGLRGMMAVTNVIANRRAKGFGSSLMTVATARSQFSAFNATDPNRASLLTVHVDDPQLVIARRLVGMAQDRALKDVTGGADHYHAIGIHPSWADPDKVTATIGTHIFYSLRG